MNFTLVRLNQSNFDTIGILYKVEGDKKEMLGIILEDEKRKSKVPGKTRIEAGMYELRLRQEGGLYNKYKSLNGMFGNGMITIVDVNAPEGSWKIHEKDGDEWEYVSFHSGVSHEQTDGCPLVGRFLVFNTMVSKLENSLDGFRAVYKEMLPAFKSGERVLLEVIDEETIYENFGKDFDKVETASKKKKKKKAKEEDENSESEETIEQLFD